MLLSLYSFSPRASAAFEADSRELFRQVMESLLLASLFCNSFILGLKIPSLTEASHKRESLSVAFFPCFYRLYICIWWLCSCMYETDHFWAWEFIIYTIMQISIFFPRKRRRAASHRKSSTIEMKLMQIFFDRLVKNPRHADARNCCSKYGKTIHFYILNGEHGIFKQFISVVVVGEHFVAIL